HTPCVDVDAEQQPALAGCPVAHRARADRNRSGSDLHIDSPGKARAGEAVEGERTLDHGAGDVAEERDGRAEANGEDLDPGRVRGDMVLAGARPGGPIGGRKRAGEAHVVAARVQKADAAT